MIVTIRKPDGTVEVRQVTLAEVMDAIKSSLEPAPKVPKARKPKPVKVPKALGGGTIPLDCLDPKGPGDRDRYGRLINGSSDPFSWR